jgi:hypothetical protein
MAYTNMLREDRFMQKKSNCFFAGEVVEGTESYEIDGTASGNFKLANLPPNAVVTDAYIHVEAASDAATTNVATLGTTEGGSELLSAANLKTTGVQGAFTGQFLTGTGKPLFLGTTVTGAATNVGKYIVVVEYLEYRKNTGEYTKISE